MLNLMAAGIYLATAAACAAAAIAESSGARAARGNLRFWWLVGAFFVLLFAMRLGGIEELARESLRQALAADGEYRARRSIQAPVAAIILATLGAVALLGVSMGTTSRRRRRPRFELVAARWSVIAMGGLIALRLVSFHGTDVLLYRGPLRLNWVIDLGATLCVALCALVAVFAPGRSGDRRHERDQDTSSF